eukprot:COSAG02_NODE_3115_length_7335_cov_2.741017_2_plen_174_part_00
MGLSKSCPRWYQLCNLGIRLRDVAHEAHTLFGKYSVEFASDDANGCGKTCDSSLFAWARIAAHKTSAHLTTRARPCPSRQFQTGSALAAPCFHDPATQPVDNRGTGRASSLQTICVSKKSFDRSLTWPAACQALNVLHGPLLKVALGEYSVLFQVWYTCGSIAASVQLVIPIE